MSHHGAGGLIAAKAHGSIAIRRATNHPSIAAEIKNFASRGFTQSMKEARPCLLGDLYGKTSMSVSDH